MRTDAKIGWICALIITLVAGGYFLQRTSDDEPISLGVARSDDVSESPATRPRTAITKKSPAADPSPVPTGRQTDPGRLVESSKIGIEQAGPTPRRIVGRDQSKTDRPPAQDSPSVSSLSLTGLTGGWSPSSSQSGKSLDQRPGGDGAGDAGRSIKPDLVGVTTPGALEQSGAGRASRERQTAVRRSIAPGSSKRAPTAGRRNETHTIQEGDTLSSLSNQYYGDERHIQDLIEANPQIQNPDVLKIGMVLQIPPVGDAATGRAPVRGERRTGKATPSTSRTYVVQPGDSFYKIAGDELGDPLRWEELFELNRPTVGDNPSNLAVGAVLVLPDK